MGARAKRKWYQKKTNWGILTMIIGTGLTLYPPTAIAGKALLGIGSSLGLYGVSDRAGKPNEAITNRKRVANTTTNTTIVNTTLPDIDNGE